MHGPGGLGETRGAWVSLMFDRTLQHAAEIQALCVFFSSNIKAEVTRVSVL